MLTPVWCPDCECHQELRDDYSCPACNTLCGWVTEPLDCEHCGKATARNVVYGRPRLPFCRCYLSAEARANWDRRKAEREEAERVAAEAAAARTRAEHEEVARGLAEVARLRTDAESASGCWDAMDHSCPVRKFGEHPEIFCHACPRFQSKTDTPARSATWSRPNDERRECVQA